MQRPDIRQRVIEAVLDLAADAGVDDVHLIAALALHRRMTEAELRHAVGDRVYDAFAPQRRCSTTTTPRTPTTWPSSARPTQGEEVEINKRAAESDLLVYVNINLVAMDGGWKSHRHRPGQRTAASATTTTSTRCSTAAVVHGPAHAASCTRRNWRMGKVIARRRRQGLPDRDDAQHRHVPEAVRLPARSASGSGRHATGPRSSARRRRSTRTPARIAPQDLPVDRGAAPDDVACRPARSRPCTR